MPPLSGNSHSALWRPLQGWTLTPAGSPTLPSEEGTTRRGDSPDYKGTHCSIGQVGKNILTRARDPPLCLMRWANHCVFTWVNDAWEPRSSVDSGSSTFCLHPCGDSQGLSTLSRLARTFQEYGSDPRSYATEFWILAKSEVPSSRAGILSIQALVQRPASLELRSPAERCSPGGLVAPVSPLPSSSCHSMPVLCHFRKKQLTSW